MAVNSPSVSIVVPCYNEEATIRLLLEALYAQTYPRGELEVLIADGMSSDKTISVICDFYNRHPDLAVKVVENPQRTIPTGLNVAIKASKGKYIIRMDAHSKPYPDYIERCIAALTSELGDNVGGVWEIQPVDDRWIARSIATAAAHPLGVGDARYRVGGKAQPVDTVPFGAFRRELIERVGLYDENLLTNEDYELNVRIRKSGGVIWFDPSIRSVYFSRPKVRDLARQYYRYGFWKGRMLQRHPGTIRLRQLIPPLLVLSLILFSLASLFFPVVRWLLIFEIVVYLLVLGTIGLQLALKKGDFALIIGFPIAAATMHVTWGSALLWSIIRR